MNIFLVSLQGLHQFFAHSAGAGSLGEVHHRGALKLRNLGEKNGGPCLHKHIRRNTHSRIRGYAGPTVGTTAFRPHNKFGNGYRLAFDLVRKMELLFYDFQTAFDSLAAATRELNDQVGNALLEIRYGTLKNWS